MKIKLVENIPTAVAILLRGRGIDVDTVIEESLGGRTDPEVLAAATREERLLITLDRGFGDVRAYQPGSHPGIIVLRPADQRVHTVVDMVETLIDSHQIDSLAAAGVELIPRPLHSTQHASNSSASLIISIRPAAAFCAACSALSRQFDRAAERQIWIGSAGARSAASGTLCRVCRRPSALRRIGRAGRRREGQ